MKNLLISTAAAIVATTAHASDPKSTHAYLEIILKIDAPQRPAAVEVYKRFKTPFLTTVAGARSKDLLVRDEDVQVLHGFDSVESARAYLSSKLFTVDVVAGLKPLLKAEPEVRVYLAP